MEFTISSTKRREILDITHNVEEAVKKSGVKEGLCNVYVPHATAAVTINENADPNLPLDILDALDRLVEEGKWRHDKLDGNAAAHIKSAIIGPGETMPIKDGVLILGTWQNIFLCDFDGPKKRRVIITIIEER